MKNKKLYRLRKGSGGGHNENALGIEHIPGDMDSLQFVSKVREKAIQLFGVGMSLDTIGTTYGVHIRFSDLNKNKQIARKLIKIVELEEEMKKIKTKDYKY